MYKKYLDMKDTMTWKELTELYNEENGTEINWTTFRQRCLKEDVIKDVEYDSYFKDGIIEARKIINLPKEYKKDQKKVLEILGYDPENWEVLQMTITTWEAHTKEQDTKQLHAVKFKIRPKEKDLKIEKFIESINNIIETDIKPFKFPKQKIITGLDKTKSMILPAVELHLGKEAREFDVGENYNVDIAIERYNKIIETIIREQEHKQVSKLIYGIGNDFLNIDTPSNTTTRGTPQNGGISSYELFDIGLKLQLEALITLRPYFNEIELILVKGNHANTLEYTLYRAIGQRFINDNIITMRKDYKDIQAIKFGNTSVFMTHGDKNYKRTIEHMSNEFYKIYGDTEFRYVLLGHLHHKQKIDELNGFTVFRLSSPSGIDRWHYKERYLAKAGQEIFTFSDEKGLENIKYLTFERK